LSFEGLLDAEIWYQAVGWAEKSLMRGGVEHDFTNVSMKLIVQPTLAPHGDGHRPVNYRVGLIIVTRDALQVETPICA
jgi:hypothetical protein